MLLERLRARFMRPRSDAHHGDEPPSRRGLAITTSVLISVVLWFTLSMRETYTVQVELPTEIVNLADDMALLEQPPASVQVQVQGGGIDLFGLKLKKPNAQIDAAQDEIVLDDLVLNLPKGVVFESVSPRVFNLRKERRIARKIPIQLRARIEAAGTEELLHPPVLDPDSIVVSGARSIVNNLAYWPTTFIRRTGLKDSVVVRVPLSDTLDGLVNKSHLATTLTAVARPFTEGTRQIRVLVSGVPSNQHVVSLEPSTVRVTYRVPLSQYDEVQQADDFFATVPYEEIRADTTGRVTPHLDYPPHLILRKVEVWPATLRYYERLVDQ